MVSQKYRWDFIGLSTDEKPTSETSDKVVNGSTYYCSDTSKLYVYCDGTWYERKPLGGGGGGGTSDFNELTNRPKYNGADMTGSTNIPEVVTYSDFTGTDGTTAGAAGLVPAPATTDAGKFLKADGTWDTAGGGGGPTVVQTTGTSQTDVMSQNAVTSMVFADPATQYKIKIGAGTSSSEGNDAIEIGHNAKAIAINTTAIGVSASATGRRSTAIGQAANAGGNDSTVLGGGTVRTNAEGGIAVGYASEVTANNAHAIAIGDFSIATQKGQMDISTLGSTNTYGYNNSQYRLLTGLYDPQSAHDAATKGYVDPTTDSSAPTTATVGRLGQIYIDTSTATAYMCVAVDTVTPAYTWKQITA